MKKQISILPFILFILCFATYAYATGHLPAEGVLLEKYYEPEKSWTEMMPVVIGNIIVVVPSPRYRSERWILVIHVKYKERAIFGKQEGKIYLPVTHEKFQNVSIGDVYLISKEDWKNSELIR